LRWRIATTPEFALLGVGFPFCFRTPPDIVTTSTDPATIGALRRESKRHRAKRPPPRSATGEEGDSPVFVATMLRMVPESGQSPQDASRDRQPPRFIARRPNRSLTSYIGQAQCALTY
jgi:hypothetical protein